MNDDSSLKSSRRSCKSATETENHDTNNKCRHWAKRKFSCNWNATCKALFLGLVLMFVGASMATVGYLVDHIYTLKDTTENETVRTREKNTLNITSISTYLGPMIMGVGGFIVVAACVMTFEQRDNAAKTVTNRLHLSAHGYSINHYSKSSPSSRHPMREGSGRRYTPAGNYLLDPLDDFTRRDLTANFIQFSRNLQQANIEKHLSLQIIGRSPSAPNLVESTDLSPLTKTGFPRHTKFSRNSLHPLIGHGFLSPHSLRRQALSVDNPEYQPYFISPPRSKRSSRQSSTSTCRESAESLEAELCRSSLNSQASMMLDLHMPNDCPISMKIRDRTRRSDTARRHILARQAQIDSEEDRAERELRCNSPQFGKGTVNEVKFQSTSTPHSRRQSLSPRIASVEDPVYQQTRYRMNEIVSHGSSSPLPCRRTGYLRSNTISQETVNRRGSNTSSSDAHYRKGSADHNYKNRRKSSNTSNSSRYCSKTNIDDGKNHRSPTSSMKSFQELRLVSQRFDEMEKGKRMRTLKGIQKNTANKNSERMSVLSSNKTNAQPLSQDSISMSSSINEGYSKSDFVSIEME